MKTITVPAMLIAQILDALPLDRVPPYVSDLLRSLHEEFVHQVSNKPKTRISSEDCSYAFADGHSIFAK